MLRLVSVSNVLLWAPQWVNLATVCLLVFAPGNLQLEAAVYALADGPLAAALIVWQSAWVFGSPSHVIRCAVLACMLQDRFLIRIFPR